MESGSDPRVRCGHWVLERLKEMAMTTYYHEYRLREQFRALAALDRQLAHWGWFRRNEGRPPKSGWRFRIGEALIRLGCWLQSGHAGRPARTSEGS
jgi:hypothetical protein